MRKRKKKKLTAAQKRAKMRAYNKAYYYANRPRILKRQKAWQKKNKKYLREYNAARYKRNYKKKKASKTHAKSMVQFYVPGLPV